MARLALSCGQYVIVDDDDLPLLTSHQWFAKPAHGGKFYAMRRAPGNVSLYMHRVLMNAPAGVEVDHINRDPLDNRRANLRLCTRNQNAWNARARQKGLRPEAIGLRGVMLDPQNGRPLWRARVKANGERYYGKRRATALQAAFDYDEIATRVHGEFASLNFPCRRAA